MSDHFFDAGLAPAFAGAGRKPLWHDQLKEWDVTESAVVNEWIAQGGAEGKLEGRVTTLVEILAGDRPRDWTLAAARAATLDEFRRRAGPVS